MRPKTRNDGKSRRTRRTEPRPSKARPLIPALAVSAVVLALCCALPGGDPPKSKTKPGAVTPTKAAPTVPATIASTDAAREDRAGDTEARAPEVNEAAPAPRATTEIAQQVTPAEPALAPMSASSETPRVVPVAANKPTFVWWEAEDASNHTFPRSNSFEANTQGEKDKLSGGTWLQTDKGSSVAARWTVDVPEDGTYHFWVRKFWKHGPFKWRWGSREWSTCTKDCALADSVELRKFLCANWVSLGRVELGRGRQTFEIEALPDVGAIAFDCFVLSRNVFTPNGKMKPGEKYAPIVDGWFAFEPDLDPFQDSAMDLRRFNEPHAGSKGFLKARGADFVFERDRTPVKFWAVNMGSESIMLERGSIDYLARKLAKLGVNMIRFHGPLYDKKSDDPTEMDAERLDGLHYMISAMKKNGIYTKVSFYYPRWFSIRSTYGIPGYDKIENNNPYGLLFFHPRMQEIYRAWARELMTRRNPYTNLTLADDPAVAIVEIVNEDNFFFWTFNPGKSVPMECMPPLEEAFGAWLKEKYGSLSRLKEVWGESPVQDGKRVDIQGVWSLTDQAKGKRNEKRVRDQAQFLTEKQRAFFKETYDFFKEDLKANCLITATNWTTADNRVLLALDKYTNMVTDVMDRHGYHDTGSNSKGGEYRDVSALFRPTSVPLTEIQYGRRPHIMSEINWQPPNRFRSELVPLLAAYGAMQGNDSYQLFCVNGTDWLKSEATKKCTVFIPVVMGQFPAASLLYRNDYVREGPVVANTQLKLKSLYELEGTPLPREVSTDEWITSHSRGEPLAADQPSPIDKLAGFVGQVVVDVSEGGGRSKYEDLSKYIDRGAKTVTSATRELKWDWGKGLVSIDTPCAQGATGFLERAGDIRLSEITINCPVEYGSLLLVSLDGKPISLSRRMLLQVMTEQKNYGWKTSDSEKKKILDLGGPPILIKNVSGSVSMKRSDARGLSVKALDFNGYEREALQMQAGHIELLPDCLYYTISAR